MPEELLIDLERSLLTPEVRQSQAALSQLIADDFLEIAQSGIAYGKDEVLSRLPTEQAPKFEVSDFSVRQLTEETYLLTYRACIGRHVDEVSYSLRSSIWQLKASAWQMVFHQGTPSTSFLLS